MVANLLVHKVENDGAQCWKCRRIYAVGAMI